MSRIKIETLIILALIIGCSQSKNDRKSKIVEIKHYTVDGIQTDVCKTILNVDEFADSLVYNYRINDTVNLTIGVMKNNDSTLTHFNERIPLIAKKTFHVNGRQIEIKKYDFDMPDEIDEEEYVYFITDYGAISTKGHGWIYITQFDDGEQFGKELFKLLRSDTSGFYGNSRIR